jgi:hypothetical protein
MASTRKKAEPQEVRRRRGNDEQEAGHPYGGDRMSQPRSRTAYLNPARESDVARATQRAPRVRRGASTRAGRKIR